MSASQSVVVVGGANTDIVGRPFAGLVMGDSNPGYTHLSSGGVGRNIAENLVCLGFSVELVTALGGDHNAHALADGCRAAGIGLSGALLIDDVPGSVYLAILDEGGDMQVAVNDMRALDRLLPPQLAERKELICSAELVVLDGNLDPASFDWLAAEVTVPMLLDPVSAAKAPRAQKILPRLAALKCNVLEAAALLGSEPLEDDVTVERAAGQLLDRGVASVYVTAGPRGVYYASAEEAGWLPAPHAGVANATGAGDAFSAGVACGMLERRSVSECAALGSALAGITLASTHTVSDRVNRGAVDKAMKGIRR